MKNFKLIHLVIALLLGATLTTGYFLSPTGSGQGYFNKDKISRFFEAPFQKETLEVTRQNAANDPRMKRSAANPTPQVYCLEPSDDNTADLLKKVRELTKDGANDFQAGKIIEPNLADDPYLMPGLKIAKGAKVANSKKQSEVIEFDIHSSLDTLNFPYPILNYNERYMFKTAIKNGVNITLKMLNSPLCIGGNECTEIIYQNINCKEKPQFGGCELIYESVLSINNTNQKAQFCEGEGYAGGCLDVDYQEAEKLYNCAKGEIQAVNNKYGKLPNQF